MSTNPVLSHLMARQRTECMTNSELAGFGSIVWSADEFCVATEEATIARPSIWTGPGRSGGALQDTADGEELLRSLLGWFNQRYRAHAPSVATFHLLRFIEIHYFLAANRETLERMGWVEGERVDGDLLRALITIRCLPQRSRRRRRRPGSAPAPLDLEAVRLLRAGFTEGTLEVQYFQRLPWRRGESARRTGGPGWTGDRSFLSPGQLLAALLLLQDLVDLAPREWRSYERRIRHKLPRNVRGLLSGTTGSRLVLMAWLLEEVELEPASACTAADRVVAAERFFKAHEERLVRDGLAIWGKRRIRWEPLLVEALACADHRLQPCSPEATPPLGYERVVVTAEAIRNRRRST